MHRRDSRQLRRAAGSGRRRIASPGYSRLANGRGDRRAHGKGRTKSLSGKERSGGGYAGAPVDTTEVPRRSRRTIAWAQLKSILHIIPVIGHYTSYRAHDECLLQRSPANTIPGWNSVPAIRVAMAISS